MDGFAYLTLRLRLQDPPIPATEELLAILGADCPGWSKMLSGTAVGQPEGGNGRREVSQ
jgi:hypothetical protein